MNNESTISSLNAFNSFDRYHVFLADTSSEKEGKICTSNEKCSEGWR